MLSLSIETVVPIFFSRNAVILFLANCWKVLVCIAIKRAITNRIINPMRYSKNFRTRLRYLFKRHFPLNIIAKLILPNNRNTIKINKRIKKSKLNRRKAKQINEWTGFWWHYGSKRPKVFNKIKRIWPNPYKIINKSLSLINY